ncbi:hypothetical protein [Microtetraspora niveoalba]|uniref:hypothetical protein n=1 Tax=Microtetraspora niveoalba TaxID=46175 RepID=UPI001FE0E697|nr:hypothetical protein [Microtetraspora niveoalba]
MAVRAEETQIFYSVVEPIPVDVVDMQGEWPTQPSPAHLTACAPVRNTGFAEGAAQCRGLLPGRPGWHHHQDFFWKAPSRRLLSLVGRDAPEVRDVDAEVFEAAADVGMGSAGPLDVEVAQHVGDAEGVGGRLGEQLGGVFVFRVRHGLSLFSGTDDFAAATCVENPEMSTI